MIRYIVQQSSFILRIHLGMSPSAGSAGHLSMLHLSGSPSGRPTCPAQPADTLSASGVPVLWRWRTPGRWWPVWSSTVGSFLRSGFSSSIPSPNSSDTLGWLSFNFGYLLEINAWIWKTLINWAVRCTIWLNVLLLVNDWVIQCTI